MSTATEPRTIYDTIHAVNLALVPIVATDRCIPRKEQAAKARQLFKRLGIKGISVTTPSYSMAQVVEIELPDEPHPGWIGFEEYEYRTYSDMPAHVPAKAAMLRRSRAAKHIEEILAVAFPAHIDRSDYVTDYFDYCWSVN